jgi:Asp-tRNA(Asn)/Glu-tRNA(Gln) amidotransferase A subunit family amidase
VFPAPRHGLSAWNWQIINCTIPGNMSDATALSIPFGRFSNGMPRGLQIMGPPGSENEVIGFAERIGTSIARQRSEARTLIVS